MPLILWLTVKNQKKNKQKPIPPKELQFHEDEVSTITLRLKSLLPLASVWSKTTINTGGVGWAGTDHDT